VPRCDLEPRAEPDLEDATQSLRHPRGDDGHGPPEAAGEAVAQTVQEGSPAVRHLQRSGGSAAREERE
jgi:hypothetical protein